MSRKVIFHPEFKPEFKAFSLELRAKIIAYGDLLRDLGFELGRPLCDTLKSRKYKNLKELRITTSDGEWRVSFAFDPSRNAILLVGANKSGISQKLFYDRLIKLSEQRFESHLKELQNV